MSINGSGIIGGVVADVTFTSPIYNVLVAVCNRFGTDTTAPRSLMLNQASA